MIKCTIPFSVTHAFTDHVQMCMASCNGLQGVLNQEVGIAIQCCIDKQNSLESMQNCSRDIEHNSAQTHVPRVTKICQEALLTMQLASRTLA